MAAATIGQFVGFTFACAGVAYIWIGILWAIQVYRRWPRFTYWSAAALAGLLGGTTAAASPDSAGIYLVGSILVVAFVLTRGVRSDRKRRAASAVSL